MELNHNHYPLFRNFVKKGNEYNNLSNCDNMILMLSLVIAQCLGRF